MRTSRVHRTGSRTYSLLSLVLVAFLVTACGPLSDDDAEPTSTDAAISQPTETADETSESETEPATETVEATGTDETTEAPDTDGPAGADSTPQPATPETPRTPPFVFDDASTPAAGSGDEAATPVNTGMEETPDDAPQPTAATFSGSDGTSGATPISVPRSQNGSTPEADDATPDGTPGLAVFEETRESTTIDLTAIDPVSVEGCSPDNVPVLIDGEASFVTSSTVNFRTGPGADCDGIGNGPLSAGIPVQVTSAPVENESDEYVWVQIRVNDITGWVILESLEAA